MKDLVCLVADKNMEAVVRALLWRPPSLGIRPIEFDIFVHEQRDPGCYKTGAEYLRGFRPQYLHGLIMLDYEWEGRPCQSVDEFVSLMQKTLRGADLLDWGDVVVIEPELEVWLFTGSPHLGHCLGWQDDRPLIRDWLHGRGLWSEGASKPSDPKRAIEEILYSTRKPRSSSIYAEIASRSTFRRCTDRSFQRLQGLLTKWFPVEMC
jgi:hypothetical protein